MPDDTQAAAAPTIWDALAKWAPSLKRWQRLTLSLSIKYGSLSDDQIDLVYNEFLAENALSNSTLSSTAPEAIVAPIQDSTSANVQLTGVSELRGVNALPPTASLTFGENLTVVYGRNGAGKTGFTRLLANACFCRNSPEILDDIYKESSTIEASAHFHVRAGGQALPPIVFPKGAGIDKLKAISVFDRIVAERHVSTSMAFEFKPSGFDVFREMARIYERLSGRIQEALYQRSTENTFPNAFLGAQTDVSQLIATLGNGTDRATLKQLAVYGEAERARFATVEGQLQSLRSASPKDAITSLQSASAAINEMQAKLAASEAAFEDEPRISRNGIADASKRAKESLAAASIDQFKRAFFKAVGSPEWEAFVLSALSLGKKEHDHYPSDGAPCLLCERPLDAPSKGHVESLFKFVESEAKQQAATAEEGVEEAIKVLRAIDISMFPEGSVVRESLKKLKPDLEPKIVARIAEMALLRDGAIEALENNSPFEAAIDASAVSESITALLAEIDADIERLSKTDQEAAIEELEQERQMLRHREVLSSVYVDVEKFLDNAAWCAKAEGAKAQFNTKRITDKEKALFGEIIGEAYREKLAKECEALECEAPVEMKTQGRGGETLRALLLKGGHRPTRILSEGEQKALALADFLTEIGLNPKSGGMVFDDPVSSQDHQRKELIAQRLVAEARHRQVIVFTHDLVFLNQLVTEAESEGVPVEKHRIDRYADGKPGQVKLGDAPAISKEYDSPHKASLYLAEAKKESGTKRDDAIRNGMGALRRTVEEIIPKFLLKGVVPRWSDRVIVGGLSKIAWDDALADEILGIFEELSKHLEGHSHTDEAMGAPPEVKDLEKAIDRVNGLIKRAKAVRSKGRLAN